MLKWIDSKWGYWLEIPDDNPIASESWRKMKPNKEKFGKFKKISHDCYIEIDE